MMNKRKAMFGLSFAIKYNEVIHRYRPHLDTDFYIFHFIYIQINII